MSSPEARLADLGLALPAVPSAAGAYVPAARANGLVFTSGQVPLAEGRLLATGKLGAGVGTSEGRDCARQCALNALAALRAEVDDLDVVTRVTKLSVFVACTPEFAEHPLVADGASALIRAVFGPAGEHARSAVGVASLPLDAPVEIEAVFETNERIR